MILAGMLGLGLGHRNKIFGLGLGLEAHDLGLGLAARWPFVRTPCESWVKKNISNIL